MIKLDCEKEISSSVVNFLSGISVCFFLNLHKIIINVNKKQKVRSIAKIKA